MEWANWFILHADRNRYGSLITSLQNDFLTNRDNYPKTLNDAYSRLANWKDPLSLTRSNTPSGVSFTNIGSSSSGSSSGSSNNSNSKKSKDHITCFNCKQKGHYSNQCTNPKVEEGTTNTTINDSNNSNNGTGTTLLNQDVHEGAFDDNDIVTSFTFMCSGHSFNTASSSKHIPDT